MPDGFNAQVEFQKIITLKELMTECRARVPAMLARIDELLANDELAPSLQLSLIDMLLNRGFGKPRMTVNVSIDPADAALADEQKVMIYLPNNNRDRIAHNVVSSTFDVLAAQEDVVVIESG